MLKKLLAVSLAGVIISMMLQGMGERFISFILLAMTSMISNACIVSLVGAYFESEN